MLLYRVLTTMVFLTLVGGKGVYSNKLSVPESLVVEKVGNFSVVNGMTFNNLNYYVSTSPNNARTNCQNLFNPQSDLLSIESEEELAVIKNMLEEYSRTEFWTSGRYDSAATPWQYRWTVNNKPVAQWLPWAPSNPPSAGFGTHRLSLFYNGEFDTKFFVQQNTRPMPFICEIPDVTVPVPCYSSNDLVIVLDASGSIGSDNFIKAKEYVAKLASAFTKSMQNKVAFSTYSDFVQNIFQLTFPFNPNQLNTWILNALYLSGTTATDLGINAAIQQISDSGRSVPKNIVIITDGRSNNPSQTEAAANRALAAGIRMFALGITPFIDQEELYKITGWNADRVFTAETFDELVQLLAPVSLRVCPDV